MPSKPLGGPPRTAAIDASVLINFLRLERIDVSRSDGRDARRQRSWRQARVSLRKRMRCGWSAARPRRRRRSAS